MRRRQQHVTSGVTFARVLCIVPAGPPPQPHSPQVHARPRRLGGGGESSGVAGALSGAVGEALLAPLWIPLDVIAQRIQVSQLPVKGGPVNFTQWRGLSIARDIYRSEGLRGYYKGTGAFLLMYVPGAAVQWGSYEVCKRFFHRMNDSFFPGVGSPGARLLSEQMASAVTAATITSCVMNPIDIVKTRIQAGRTIPSYEALLPHRGNGRNAHGECSQPLHRAKI